MLLYFTLNILKEIQIAGLGSLVSWKGDQIFGLQQRFSVDLIEFLVSRDGIYARWMLVKDDKQVLEVCRLNFWLGIELRVRLHYGPRPNTLSLKSNHPVDREQKTEAKEFTLRSSPKHEKTRWHWCGTTFVVVTTQENIPPNLRNQTLSLGP